MSANQLGESAEVTLCDGSLVQLKLAGLKESHDTICFAVRKAGRALLPTNTTTSSISRKGVRC